jgi:sialate O-acetylesterase
MPTIFSNGMVLQRNDTVPVWGSDSAHEELRLIFRGCTVSVSVDSGKWRGNVPTGDAGGPFQLIIQGDGIDTLIDSVYVGDVWVVSGQSNAAMTRDYYSSSFANPPTAGHIRFCIGTFEYLGEPTPWRDFGSFSNFGLNFGGLLWNHVRVPIGLIYAADGGTSVQAWTPKSEVLPQDISKISGFGGRYDTCIAPLMPFRIKGVIWWQGEGNCTPYVWDEHKRYLNRMVSAWRRNWGQGDFPFIVMQMQALGESYYYSATNKSAVGYVRDAHRRVMELENCAVAVSYDLTSGLYIYNPDPGTLHPCVNIGNTYFQPIVNRVVLAARALAYGEEIEWSGPLYRNASYNSGEVTVEFNHLAGGLKPFDTMTTLHGFEIEKIGDSVHPVSARISDDSTKIILDVSQFSPPFFVRYATHPVPDGNLYNSEGLPAPAFISDTVYSTTGASALNLIMEEIGIEACPNPFNPTVKIRISGSIGTVTELAIYNIKGEKIADFSTENKLKLAYLSGIAWDASTQSSGTYFIKLRTIEKVIVKTVMLLR